jgi:hypothetical protein
VGCQGGDSLDVQLLFSMQVQCLNLRRLGRTSLEETVVQGAKNRGLYRLL